MPGLRERGSGVGFAGGLKTGVQPAAAKEVDSMDKAALRQALAVG